MEQTDHKSKVCIAYSVVDQSTSVPSRTGIEILAAQTTVVRRAPHTLGALIRLVRHTGHSTAIPVRCQLPSYSLRQPRFAILALFSNN
ncbi:hypothetical protein HAX54_006724 [Datura stramonium]|uniref:Uncharacterized protein n=1 Tax=Datura stramonium TaxID=4076 RepID=A0ABS8TAR8_DATST|nr:hypothetical protein [Datura stramonium]